GRASSAEMPSAASSPAVARRLPTPLTASARTRHPRSGLRWRARAAWAIHRLCATAVSVIPVSCGCAYNRKRSSASGNYSGIEIPLATRPLLRCGRVTVEARPHASGDQNLLVRARISICWRSSTRALIALVGETFPHGPERSLRARREIELAQDVADVRTSRALADHQVGRDLLVRLARGHHPEDL